MKIIAYPKSMKKRQKCRFCQYHASYKSSCSICNNTNYTNYKTHYEIGDFLLEAIKIAPHGKNRKKNKWSIEIYIKSFDSYDIYGSSKETWEHAWQIDTYSKSLHHAYKLAFKNIQNYIQNGYQLNEK